MESQPTATAVRTNLADVATACGFVTSCTVDSDEGLNEAVTLARNAVGPALVVAKVEVEELPMRFPYSFDGVTAINRFRDAIE